MGVVDRQKEQALCPARISSRKAAGAGFEEMLEILIGIAQSEGRDFLPYLLRMALMEARNYKAPTTHLSH